MNEYVTGFLRAALLEDMGHQGDITTDYIFDDDHYSEAKINFRETGILAGLIFIEKLFHIVDANISFESLKSEGEDISSGCDVALIKGSTKHILNAERTALNLLQRTSGIATNTKRYVDKLAGYSVKLADTRKTTPLLRYFEKYAVRIGGGVNHRFGLYDAVLIKDNHISAAGSIQAAVKKVRENAPFTAKVEVEVETYEEAREALESGVDIVMLDNIKGNLLQECVQLLKGKVTIEASGNINLENISTIASTGIDIISSSSMVSTARNIDIGLDFVA